MNEEQEAKKQKMKMTDVLGDWRYMVMFAAIWPITQFLTAKELPEVAKENPVAYWLGTCAPGVVICFFLWAWFKPAPKRRG